MSEKLCTLRGAGGGGGKYTETSLWTNPSPTSSFAGQDVTLSESIDNFKYIAVKFKSTTTSSSDSQMATVIYKVEDIKKATSPSAALQPVSAFGNLNSGNTNYNYRYIVYKGSTTLFIANAYSINASGSNSSLAIPLEILGLNELAQGKTNQTILWTNPSPTSSFAAQTISLDLSGYDAIILKCSSMTTNTLPATYPTNICSQQYLSVPYGVAGSGGSTYRISYGIGVESSNSFNSNRETIVTTTGVTFSGGYRNYSAGNQYAIPIQIIGVKIS